ncbi:MAG: 1,4-alpha-glucan branching protein GlgB [Propionibacteriaceae bacterium]
MSNDNFGGLAGRDFEGWHSGGDTECWKRLGSHLVTVTDAAGAEVSGVRFAVWAPNAKAVRVRGNFNAWGRETYLSLIPGSGVWATFIPGIGAGEIYKYEICDPNSNWLEKVDPMAIFAESAPNNGSIVYQSQYQWQDAQWLSERARKHTIDKPISIYELHVGSWRQGKSYADLATELVDYVVEMGYTHVEFMPIAEHPYTPSWGYQVSNYFAPTSRWGRPDELRALIDAFHQRGIGVLLDWVPGHFPKDGWALGRFDGTALYEHADPRQGEHIDWGTYIFNYGRNEVKSFLVSNALYWIQEFHFDGLRVDAVASMLYLDYSRPEGQWVPNKFGGNHNLEAIDLLRYVTTHLAEREPGALVIAEESTSFAGVTKPVGDDGLGFDFKWNMGWMNDSLRYLSHTPQDRQWHYGDITFAMVYAYSENFILPISHDEVVHGKGSLINKIPGEWWQQFPTLRAFYSYMWAWPGKQLTFMGSEFAQWLEFNEQTSLDWPLVDLKYHSGMIRLIQRLNSLYTTTPALYEQDGVPEGFQWLIGEDAAASVFGWLRWARDGSCVACVTNFGDQAHNSYRIGLPYCGTWTEILNTNDLDFDGEGSYLNGTLDAVTSTDLDDWAAQTTIALAPLSCVWLAFDPTSVPAPHHAVMDVR